MDWLTLARTWTRHAPFGRGKDRLAALALGLSHEPPTDVVCETTDGRRLFVDPASHSYGPVYFKGTYEPGVTSVVTQLLRPGDVCLDVGANIGWYTTLCATLVGPTGSVHAFEPLLATFRQLERNVGLLADASHVHLNCHALGDTSGAGVLHVFPGVPDGHTSLADFGRTDAAAHDCVVTTVDEYLAEHRVGEVTFVKLDIEGAELQCLRGAGRLFAQPTPPLWIVEMALATSRGFNYRPGDLVAHMRAHGDFEFFAIGESDGALTPLDGFAPGDPGAYVLCAPRAHHRDRLAAALERR